ncbi:amidoligase enzyme [Legionella israelensis]|uniref:amidoligase family protein n=1 Tax=Legionella israelensis TaxID=454 RepID=UPI00117BFECC|nr:amidoligase family protein [Legionella israelensis]QDP73259.1 amidoligase enzyme [Legionella israelensis]
MNTQYETSSKDLFPPYLKNHEGNERLVGFEIEFVGISIDESIQLLKNLFSGNIKRLNQNEYILNDSCLGQFKVELDAHLLKQLAAESEKNRKENKMDIKGYIEQFISSALDEIIPLEIITPPVTIQSIQSLDSIVDDLREHGAKGTHTSKIAAFGVHVNPDIPSLSAACILSFLRAYVLLNDWLRNEIDVDFSRAASPFINEYPRAYKKKILQSDYQPSMDTLMRDYIRYNRTRNRALDMLPLFMYIDEQTVKEKVGSRLIHARPTFHYRLANSNLNLPDWNFTTEWRRWLYIEKLAANELMQEEMVKEYLALERQSVFFNKNQWINTTSNYLQDL